MEFGVVQLGIGVSQILSIIGGAATIGVETVIATEVSKVILNQATKFAAQEAAKETAKMVAQQATKVAAKETAKVVAQQATKVAAKETAKVVAQQATKVAAKETAKVVAQQATKETAKTVTKQVAKLVVQQSVQIGPGIASMGLKMVPLVGLAVGTVSGIVDICNGNIGYGLLSFGQGLVSMIPGVGTGVSIAMGVAVGTVRIADTVSRATSSVQQTTTETLTTTIQALTLEQLLSEGILDLALDQNIKIANQILTKMKYKVDQKKPPFKICRFDLIGISARIAMAKSNGLISAGFQNHIQALQKTQCTCGARCCLQRGFNLPNSMNIQVCTKCIWIILTPITYPVAFQKIGYSGQGKVIKCIQKEKQGECSLLNQVRLKQGMIFVEDVSNLHGKEPHYDVYKNYRDYEAKKKRFTVTWHGALGKRCC